MTTAGVHDRARQRAKASIMTVHSRAFFALNANASLPVRGHLACVVRLHNLPITFKNITGSRNRRWFDLSAMFNPPLDLASARFKACRDCQRSGVTMNLPTNPPAAAPPFFAHRQNVFLQFGQLTLF